MAVLWSVDTPTGFRFLDDYKFFLSACASRVDEEGRQEFPIIADF